MARNQYYRLPVEMGDRLHRMLGDYERQQQGEPNVMQRRRRQAQALHRERLLSFESKIKSNGTLTVESLDEPCECERNHYAIAMNGSPCCPLIYWLNMCQLVRLRQDDRMMRTWAKDHPLDLYMRQIRRNQDATYQKEDDYAATG